MRKLMALAIVLVFAGATRSWALFGLQDVSYDGSLEFVGLSAKNEVDQDNKGGGTASDHHGGVNSRLRVGVNAGVTDKVKSRIEFLRRDAQFGRRFGAGSAAGSSNSIDNETANIVVENAYLDLEDLFGFSARLGRQFVGNAGDLVWNISPTDNDALTSGAIDGILLKCRHYDFIHGDLFLGKASEDDTVSGTTATDNTDAAPGDVNLNSFDLTFPTILPGGTVNAGYLWGRADNTSLTSDSNALNTIRVGARGGVMENMFTYRAEYFKNGGENKTSGTKVKYKGSAIDLGVGFNSAETPAGKFGLAANWISASGDSNTGDNDDKTFHDFTVLGLNSSDRLLGEIFGKSASLTGDPSTTRPGKGVDTGAQGQGMQVINLCATWTPTFVKNTMVDVDYFMFDTAEDGTTSALSKGDSYGDEIDVTVAVNHTSNFRTEWGYAMLSPGKAITTPATPENPDDAVTKLFARAKVTWGGN